MEPLDQDLDESELELLFVSLDFLSPEPLDESPELPESLFPLSREAARFDSVRLAYAIRWLELGDGRSRPAWPQQLLDRGPRLT